MRFGKQSAKRSLKTLSLSNYMNASQIAYPQKWAWERPIKYGMLANDVLGDCVIAGAAHLEMNWVAVAHADAPFILSTDQVIADYSVVGGYVRGQPATDQGCNMLDAMQYWLRKGYVGMPPAQSFATLDIQNIDHIKAALYFFGGLAMGFNVPQSMVDELSEGLEPTFRYLPNDKPSGNGHCVIPIGYGRKGFALISWGKVFRTSWDFWLANVDEAYCVVSKDWLKISGISPVGLDLDGLMADQDAVKA